LKANLVVLFLTFAVQKPTAKYTFDQISRFINPANAILVGWGVAVAFELRGYLTNIFEFVVPLFLILAIFLYLKYSLKNILKNLKLLKLYFDFIVVFLMSVCLFGLILKGLQADRVDSKVLKNELIYLLDSEKTRFGKQWYGLVGTQVWQLNFSANSKKDLDLSLLQAGQAFFIEAEVTKYEFKSSAEFDWSSFASTVGVKGKLSVSSISKRLTCDWLCLWISTWDGLKTKQSEILYQNICQNFFSLDFIWLYKNCPQIASLSQGLVLGDDSGFNDEIKKIFQRQGLSHIVAVSGFNITIIILVSAWFSQKLGMSFSWQIWFQLIFTFIFIWLVGFSPSVLRAGAMSYVLILAKSLGRKCHPVRALFIGSLILLSLNPLFLFSVSFQLSFLATLGLLLGWEILPDWSSLNGNFLSKLKSEVFSVVNSTLMASLWTVPVLINTFGFFNPFSSVSNALVLPLIPILMFLNILASVPILGLITGSLTGFLQSSLLATVSFLDGFIPVLSLSYFSFWEVLIWYSGLILAGWYFKYTKSPFKIYDRSD
jgi:ComEC/Rec2-related protein